jgi:small subunit ribosomal protein S9
MKERVYATGRRKESVARVWITPKSKGDKKINGKSPMEYFCREDLVIHLLEPLKKVELEDTVTIFATVKGGGVRGQAGALRLGIARALAKHDPELRVPLKKAGYLTRDPREVERKKYGKPKARKRFQFSKR